MRPSSSSGGGEKIYRNNGLGLDMAIVDLSQAEAISFNIVESDIFRKVITLDRTVGPDYCPLNRNMIVYELLDLNWKSHRTKITKDLMAETYIFGIVLIGYLTTIKGGPLISIIASSSKLPHG